MVEPETASSIPAASDAPEARPQQAAIKSVTSVIGCTECTESEPSAIASNTAAPTPQTALETAERVGIAIATEEEITPRDPPAPRLSSLPPGPERAALRLISRA
jgi:hypothetical protein